MVTDLNLPFSNHPSLKARSGHRRYLSRAVRTPSSSPRLNSPAGTGRSRFIISLCPDLGRVLDLIASLVLLDHFKVQGVSGEHDALMLQITGLHLGAMFDDKPTVTQQAIKSLIRSSCVWRLAQRKHYI